MLSGIHTAESVCTGFATTLEHNIPETDDTLFTNTCMEG